MLQRSNSIIIEKECQPTVWKKQTQVGKVLKIIVTTKLPRVVMYIIKVSLLSKIGDDYIVIINSVPFESAMLNLDIGR